LFKKIGIFTIIGISITIVCLTFYINSLYERLLPDNYLYWMSGLLLGLLFVIIDIIHIERRDKIKIFDSRLGVFFKIALISFLALVFSSFVSFIFIYYYAFLFYSIVFVIIFIPSIIIGFILFLILIRFSFAKIINIKKIRIFYIILVLFISILSINYSLILLSPTYSGRLNIESLMLSSDSNKLLVNSYGYHIISEDIDIDDTLWENFIWNTQTGEVLLHEKSNQSNKYRISPDGKYILNEYGSTIASVASGDIVDSYEGKFHCWSQNGEYFATTKNDDVYVWNMNNFSNIAFLKGIKYNKVTMSPNGSRLVMNGNGSNIYMHEVFSENTTPIWQKTIDKYAQFAWSESGEKLQIIHYIPTENVSMGYRLLILNVSDGKELYNTSFELSVGSMAENKIMHIAFELYVYYDAEKDILFFYNLSDVTKQYKIKGLWKFDLSYDKSIMVWGRSNGFIEIRNASTGALIRTFKTPTYEFASIPGFEIITVIFATTIVFLFNRNRLKKNPNT